MVNYTPTQSHRVKSIEQPFLIFYISQNTTFPSSFHFISHKTQHFPHPFILYLTKHNILLILSFYISQNTTFFSSFHFISHKTQHSSHPFILYLTKHNILFILSLFASENTAFSSYFHFIYHKTQHSSHPFILYLKKHNILFILTFISLKTQHSPHPFILYLSKQNILLILSFYISQNTTFFLPTLVVAFVMLTRQPMEKNSHAFFICKLCISKIKIINFASNVYRFRIISKLTHAVHGYNNNFIIKMCITAGQLVFS